MPGLPATATARGTLATLALLARRVGARRGGGVARAAGQPSLKLRDALVLARDVRLELRDAPLHRQQHLDDRLTALVIDRLRLDPLHNTGFDNTGLCPPPTERLLDSIYLQGLCLGEGPPIPYISRLLARATIR